MCCNSSSSLPTCSLSATQLHALRDIADRRYLETLKETLSQRVSSATELDEAFLIDGDHVLGKYGKPEALQLRRFDDVPDPEVDGPTDVRDCLRWDLLETDGAAGPVVELRTSDDSPWATPATRSLRRDTAPRAGQVRTRRRRCRPYPPVSQHRPSPPHPRFPRFALIN